MFKKCLGSRGLPGLEVPTVKDSRGSSCGRWPLEGLLGERVQAKSPRKAYLGTLYLESSANTPLSSTSGFGQYYFLNRISQLLKPLHGGE